MLPFSLFLRADRPNYYVAFKNETTGRFLSAISTKKDNENDALRQAWAWYRNGIPNKKNSLDLKARSLRDTVRQADISSSDAEYIINELKRRGLVLSCVFASSPSAVLLSDFLTEFWDWDRSPYIREKLRAEHGIHKNYVNGMVYIIKKYWFPFFSSKLLGELQPSDLECFIDSLSNVKCKGKEKTLSNIRKNGIIRAGAIPLRWAYRKGKINNDITRGLVMFSKKTAMRQILTPQLVASIFNQVWDNQRSKVANIVSMVTGIRAGELQGLQYCDLGNDCLYIRHSWNPHDKLKTPKNNCERIVVLPPCVLLSLKCIAELNPHGVNNNSFVFWASISPDKPMEQKLFTTGLRKSLIASGLNKSVANSFTFHAWRHFFTSYMRNKLEDKLLQSQTGHKTKAMLDWYSAHLLPGDSDKIREAQREVFSLLLPS